MGELLEGKPVPLTSEEMTYWSAYFELEPQGEQRADFRQAVLLMLVHNAWRDPKRGRSARLKDYFPLWRPQDEEEEQDAEEMLAAMQMWGAIGDEMRRQMPQEMRDQGG